MFEKSRKFIIFQVLTTVCYTNLHRTSTAFKICWTSAAVASGSATSLAALVVLMKHTYRCVSDREADATKTSSCIEPSEETEPLPADIFTKPISIQECIGISITIQWEYMSPAWNTDSTVAQRHAYPELQAEEFGKLLPVRKALAIKRSERCKVRLYTFLVYTDNDFPIVKSCDHSLCKAEFNPSSVKFKMLMAAMNHVPDIRLLQPVTISKGQVHTDFLMFHFYLKPVHVLDHDRAADHDKLGAEPDPRRSAAWCAAGREAPRSGCIYRSSLKHQVKKRFWRRKFRCASFRCRSKTTLPTLKTRMTSGRTSLATTRGRTEVYNVYLIVNWQKCFSSVIFRAGHKLGFRIDVKFDGQESEPAFVSLHWQFFTLVA